MRVFLLGASGSIGQGLVHEMLARGYEVTALSRSDTSDSLLTKWGVTPCKGDLRDPFSWAKKAVGCAAIVHAAAVPFDDMPAVDRDVTNALIAAAKKTTHRPRLIYTGSCWLYGETGDQLAHEGPPFDPHPSFEWMITSAEKLLACRALSTAILTPGMVYHRDGGVFRRFLAPAQAGRPIEIWKSGEVRWPLIHRDDLSNAYCNLIERPHLSGHFNAATETGVRVAEIADVIASALGSSADHRVLSVDQVIERYGAWASGCTIDQQMGSERLRQEAGWAPKALDWRRSDLMERLSVL